MPKFEVRTTNAILVFDAETEVQASYLGRDGGRIVLSVTELDEEGDPAGPARDPRDADFGDEEIVVVPRSEYDRLVAIGRLNDEFGKTADVPSLAETAGPAALGAGEEIVSDADGAPSVDPGPAVTDADGQPIEFETVTEGEPEREG